MLMQGKEENSYDGIHQEKNIANEFRIMENICW